MRTALSVTLIGVLAVAISGMTLAQDKDAKGKMLPQGWGKLGLSEDQKTKIYDIQKKYNGKIEDLKKQIADEEEKMRKERYAVLTPEQKTKLKENDAKKYPDEDKKKGS